MSQFLKGRREAKYSVRAGGSGDEGKVARRKETNSWKIDFSGEKPATPLLDTINYPIHMRNLSTRDLDQLAAELRADIVYSVSKTEARVRNNQLLVPAVDATTGKDTMLSLEDGYGCGEK
ncbi:hypothetical protein AAC387_Pa01g2743 [Persea americana]